MNRVRHVKKDDTVLCLSGSQKGEKGKVLAVNPAKGLVQVDGIGVVKRHTKPTQTSPKGGIVSKNAWMPASKFMACTDGGKAKGRAGFQGEGKDKKRVYSGDRK